MTRKEAKNVIDNIWDFADAQDEEKGDIVDDAIIEVLECMEKQIPKKLDKVKIYDRTYFVCPICGFPLHSRHKFCHCCGQALDWTEEGE